MVRDNTVLSAGCSLIDTSSPGNGIVFDGKGHLFLALGENNQRPTAQKLDHLQGKVVRLNLDGSVPEDNPFVGQDDVRPEIWSYGHRNVQSADIHPQTGALWTAEHGSRGGDELNLTQAGLNYGWPVISYGLEYSRAPVNEGIAVREGMEQPNYYWDPVIAPGGMVFYRGDLFPWRGDLLIAGLRSRALVRLRLDGARVVGGSDRSGNREQGVSREGSRRRCAGGRRSRTSAPVPRTGCRQRDRRGTRAHSRTDRPVHRRR